MDEAGDGTLFDKKGRTIIGQDGCSKFFIIGAIEVTDPQRLAREMEALRAELLAEPYFRRVESMQPHRKKTALLFHAKDDVPEVRREVFRLLLRHDIKFYAAVRNKTIIERNEQKKRSTDPTYRYNQNHLYDWTVTRVFYRRLDPDMTYDVHFASRGNKARTEALKEALTRVSCSSAVASPLSGSQNAPSVRVHAVDSKNRAELQATDYMLWTLQRFWETKEERFLELMWPHYRMVRYLHGRDGRGGVCEFGQSAPLTLAAVAGLPDW